MAGIYPTSLAAAFPEKSRIDKAKADLEKAGVKYVFSCWIDILGSAKTKPVPVSEFERLCIGKGPQFAVHSVSMFPELGPADPDQIPIPDLDAIFVCPWNPEIAIVFADLYYEDAPYDVCPRMALKRTMQEAADAGYAFYAGMEPEFIVLRYDDQGQPVKAIDDDPEAGDGLRPKRQAFGYDVEYSLELDAVPRRRHRAAEYDGLGPQERGLRRRLFAVRDRLRLLDRARHGRPLHLPAHSAQRDRQASRPVRHLHAEAGARRLAERRAYQLERSVDRQSGQEPVQGRGERRLERDGAMGCGRRAQARRGADRGQLPDGEQLQGSDRQSPRSSRAAR